MASNVVNLAILLLLVVLYMSDAKVFLSIDCGAGATYTDDKNIDWTLDEPYVNTGESFELSSMYSSIETEINTLRVFKTSPKSCYSISVGNGEQVLVRATFYYGNYDGLKTPPTFDLQLNGKYWGTVVGDINNYYTYEAIIVAGEGVISVCLVRTFAGQFPFISALEVRSLDANMYNRSNPDRALYLASRLIGSNIQTVRYPDDIYDRIWSPTSLVPTSSSDTLQTININLQDNPPVAALQGAVSSSLTNTPISFTLGADSLPEAEVPVLMKMYFVELDLLDVSDKRSFDVYIGTKRLTSTPITPSYGNASEWTFTNFTASSTSVFSLKATSDSTLPPIINAFEVYIFSGDSDTSSNGSSNTGNGNGDNSNDNTNGSSGTSSGNNNNANKKNKFNPRNQSKKKKSKNTGTIVGTTVPISILLLAAAGGSVIWHHKRKAAAATVDGNKAMSENGDATMPDGTPNSTHHIMNMSNNTSEA